MTTVGTVGTVETQGVVGNTITTTLRTRGWCFTLNNYNEEEYENIKVYGHTNTAKFVVGKEVGAKGTKHLQGYLYFSNGKTFDQIKKINPKAHWEKAKGNPDQNFKYCSKEGDFESKGFEKKITLGMKLREKCLKKYENVEWKDWQKSLISKIEKKPDSRTINWIVDLAGNSGKSFLTKYLALTREVIIADGKKDNIFNQVNRKLNEEELEFELVILDIPRSSEGYVNYGVLEQLKNGLIYSGKYEGGMCIFDDVHVIVFANFHPDRTQFSEDRWNIVELS